MKALLKPCPFCGGTDLIQKRAYIRCNKCEAEGPVAKTEDGEYNWEPEAVAATWNRRTP